MKLTTNDFERLPGLPGVTADERRALYEASDAIAQCCGDCAQGRRPCPVPQACECPESGSEEIPGWLLAVLMVCALVVVAFFSPGVM